MSIKSIGQKPSTLPQYLRLPWGQAVIAVDCLKKCLEKRQQNSEQLQAVNSADAADESSPLLPYLIHASVLLFLVRDMLAYEWLRHQSAFKESPLPGKIRQTPTVDQSIALLKSAPQTEALAGTLAALQDKALAVEELRLFRNNAVQWGIPSDSESSEQISDAPFPLQAVDYHALSLSAIAMWDGLQHWRQANASE